MLFRVPCRTVPGWIARPGDRSLAEHPARVLAATGRKRDPSFKGSMFSAGGTSYPTLFVFRGACYCTLAQAPGSEARAATGAAFAPVSVKFPKVLLVARFLAIDRSGNVPAAEEVSMPKRPL